MMFCTCIIAAHIMFGNSSIFGIILLSEINRSSQPNSLYLSYFILICPLNICFLNPKRKLKKTVFVFDIGEGIETTIFDLAQVSSSVVFFFNIVNINYIITNAYYITMHQTSFQPLENKRVHLGLSFLFFQVSQFNLFV